MDNGHRKNVGIQPPLQSALWSCFLKLCKTEKLLRDHVSCIGLFLIAYECFVQVADQGLEESGRLGNNHP